MHQPPTWAELIFAVAAVVVGVTAAVLIRVLVKRLNGRLPRSAWTRDDVFVNALRDLASSALVIGGAWFAATLLPLTGTVSKWTYRLLLSLLILLVALAVSRLVGSLVRTVLTKTGVASSASIFVNIARIAVLAVGMLILLQTMGVSITPLLTAMGVGGIAIALALQDTLANLFAGVHLLASRKLQPGNYIKLPDGHEGYVVDINWRNTTMRDLLDNMVIVPNAMISNSAVVNYDQPAKDLYMVVQARVTYDCDLATVERIIVAVGRDVLSSIDGGVADAEPVVRFHTFGDLGIEFSVIMQIEEYGDQFLIKHEFVKRLHERFRAEGIDIPHPMRGMDFLEREPLGTAAS
ncbi:MAG: mechanosensitive ion channel [Streptosporangiales bacterium]|nr:mechanosensitive ion channel [Streptosporangiales bacterium]